MTMKSQTKKEKDHDGPDFRQWSSANNLKQTEEEAIIYKITEEGLNR